MLLWNDIFFEIIYFRWNFVCLFDYSARHLSSEYRHWFGQIYGDTFWTAGSKWKHLFGVYLPLTTF